MNEERERAVAADVRSRVIADCAALLPLARNASFKVFRGLSVRAGNPLNLSKRFRSGAVDFFRMLVRQDPMLIQLVHRGPWRRFAYDLLFAALKANQYLLQLRQVPSALLRPLRSLVRFHSTEDRERTTEIPNGKLEVLNRTIRHEHERTRREIVKSINARNTEHRQGELKNPAGWNTTGSSTRHGTTRRGNASSNDGSSHGICRTPGRHVPMRRTAARVTAADICEACKRENPQMTEPLASLATETIMDYGSDKVVADVVRFNLGSAFFTMEPAVSGSVPTVDAPLSDENERYIKVGQSGCGRPLP